MKNDEMILKMYTRFTNIINPFKNLHFHYGLIVMIDEIRLAYSILSHHISYVKHTLGLLVRTTRI
uniref:Uncharacterized protein n=1 Tax=Rhizophora mucronata TaxID=61149 RepID=A0A2P2QV68_RHIMU